MRRELPCAVCQASVRIGSRSRFLRLVREGGTVCCEQCRAAFSPVTSRVVQREDSEGVPSSGLRRKRGRGAKVKRGLESLPFSPWFD